MKIIHQNWEPNAFMQRLPSDPPWPAISRPLLNKGKVRSRCPATTRVGVPPVRQAFSPREALSVPPYTQVVPSVLAVAREDHPRHY